MPAAPDGTTPPDAVFGVTVPDVLALASHVKVIDGAAAGSTDSVFGSGAGGLHGASTTADVRRWIEQVAAMVDVRTRRRASLTDPAHTSTVTRAAGAVVAVGAAAYLVDAAFPANASVNDSGAYGAVLWARYKDELAELVLLLDELAGTTAGGAASGTGSSSFPPPSFPDSIRW